MLATPDQQNLADRSGCPLDGDQRPRFRRRGLQRPGCRRGRASSDRHGFEHLGRLLPVGGIELLKITRNALLDLRHAPLHLGAREVLVAVVHRLELAAVEFEAKPFWQRASRSNATGSNTDGTSAYLLSRIGGEDNASSWSVERDVLHY